MRFKINIKKTVRSALGVLLSGAVAVSGVAILPTVDFDVNVNAAWDGYKESEEMITEFSLLDMNEYGAILDTGAIVSRKNVKDGCIYSALWNDHLTNGDFWIKEFAPGIPSDWSAFNRLEMEIYSSKATGATIMPVIYSPAPSGASGTYFHGMNFKVDWEGWKTVTLDFTAATSGQNSTWSNISQFRLVSNGNWSLVGHPETELYIASVKVKGTPVSYDFTTSFYGEEKISEALSAMEGSVAVYAGAPNAVTSAGYTPLEYTIEKTNGKIMVPAKLFGQFLGAEVKDDGTAWSVTLGDKTVSSDAISYAKDSVTYVDGESVAKALGLYAFTDGKLLVMGSEKSYNALRRTANLGVNEYNEIVAQKTYASEMDLSKYSEEDCDIILNRWRERIVGSLESLDMTDPDIASKVKNFAPNAKKIQATINRTPLAEIFIDSNSNASADMTNDYNKVLSMAKAYACPVSELYGDEALKNDIIFCLDWLYENRYSVKGRANWKFTGFDNWYNWDIATPKSLAEILICMKDVLSVEDMEKYWEYYTVNMPMPKATGANYAEEAICVIASALLRQDYKKVLQVQADLQKLYLFVDDNERITESQLEDEARKAITPMKGAGYFTDGSYILHTLHAMNGAYGTSHFGSFVSFEQIFADTAFAMNTPLRDNIPVIFSEGVEKLLFGSVLYRHVMGRSENPNNANSGCSLLAQMFMAAEYFEDDIRDEVYSIVKTAYNSGLSNKSSYIGALTIDHIKKFKEIMADESIPEIKDYKLSKIYYNIDKTVHERDNWAIGVSMSSSRIFNYECINNQNVTGWYLGDGRTEYYVKGDNSNAVSSYWKNMNPYRLPGTTVDTQERRAVTIGQGCEYLSSKDFVGGVALSNEYSAAAMHLESYHNEFDYPAGKGMSDYGGPAPAHKNDLVAQKSYYMLDDGVICLGAGINAKDNNNAEVLTIIENIAAGKTVNLSNDAGKSEPYKIVSAVASHTPEEANIAPNTIDGDYTTKWAGTNGNEIVWDTGAVQNFGYASISLMNGQKRSQKLTLQISSDGNNWETVFEGASSGQQETDEVFDLGGKDARYLKYINHGNSANSEWVSITECKIYPVNPDGTIGLSDPEIYGADEIVADGNVLELIKDEIDISDKTWLSIDGRCGYYFPKERGENPGSIKAHWTKGEFSYLEMWYAHGVNPTNGTYAYVLLPGASTTATKAFADANAITILANNNKVQAAKDNRTGVTYITFWEKGSFGGVTVDNPCMVIMQDKESEFKIAASDPTQKLTSLNVSFLGAYTPVSADEVVKIVPSGSNTVLKINAEGSVGRSVECVFKK